MTAWSGACVEVRRTANAFAVDLYGNDDRARRLAVFGDRDKAFAYADRCAAKVRGWVHIDPSIDSAGPAWLCVSRRDATLHANWLWRRRQRDLRGTPAETFLRDACGFTGPIPEGFGFIPGTTHALTCAYRHPTEPWDESCPYAKPAPLNAREVCGIHVILLDQRGYGLAGTACDVFDIGEADGIVELVPAGFANDVAVCKTLQGGIAIHEITGHPVWITGGASRLETAADMLSIQPFVTAFVERDTDAEGIETFRKLQEAGNRFGTHILQIRGAN